MGMGMPFGDDVMTIIMGIDPSDPGMHGPMREACPENDDAIAFVCKLRDMCDEFLRSAGKGGTDDTSSQQDGDTGEGEDDGIEG